MKNTNEGSGMLQMVEIDHNKFAVETLDGNVRVNLTQMAKPFGSSKRPLQWLRTNESQSYLSVASKALKCALADLVQVKKGGNNSGTWCTDYRVAVRFAQWLDPVFAFKVDQLLVDLMRGNLALYKPFNGIYPIIIDGKAYYYQVDVLKSLGFSTRSGMVSRRKRNFPQHFKKMYGRNFVTIEFCNYLKNRRAIVQLDIDFQESTPLLKGGQA